MSLLVVEKSRTYNAPLAPVGVVVNIESVTRGNSKTKYDFDMKIEYVNVSNNSFYQNATDIYSMILVAFASLLSWFPNAL